MKVGFITNSLAGHTGGGWGRYGIGLIKTLAKIQNIEFVILTNRSAEKNKEFTQCCRPISPNHRKILKGLNFQQPAGQLLPLILWL